MKASLSVEAIGSNFIDQIKLWKMIFSEIGMPNLYNLTFGDALDFKRWGCWEICENKLKEVYGKKDYSKSNSVGSRGIKINYMLESGKKYIVKSPQSWKRTDVYICCVDKDGEIIREKTIRN